MIEEALFAAIIGIYAAIGILYYKVGIVETKVDDHIKVHYNGYNKQLHIK